MYAIRSYYGSRGVLAEFERNDGRWHRMITVDEEVMDQKRGHAQQRLGKEVADMNSYYILTVPEGEEAAAWIDRLNELPEVEIARPVPLPAPMPLPGDYQDQLV